jgi:hypothetical protein
MKPQLLRKISFLNKMESHQKSPQKMKKKVVESSTKANGSQKLCNSALCLAYTVLIYYSISRFLSDSVATRYNSRNAQYLTFPSLTMCPKYSKGVAADNFASTVFDSNLIIQFEHRYLGDNGYTCSCTI